MLVPRRGALEHRLHVWAARAHRVAHVQNLHYYVGRVDYLVELRPDGVRGYEVLFVERTGRLFAQAHLPVAVKAHLQMAR